MIALLVMLLCIVVVWPIVISLFCFMFKLAVGVAWICFTFGWVIWAFIIVWIFIKFIGRKK